ncbi:MAG: arginase [Bacteroidota bacterium]
MSKDIVFLINKSEITAGTRGASLGPEAIMAAARKNNNTIFADHPIVEIKNFNYLLDHPTNHKFAKRIDGLLQVYTELNQQVSTVLLQNKFPLLLAADHGSAGGTIAGIKSAFPNKKLGIIWIDAHADIHTPYTTPSGNMHGMPLATVLNDDNMSCKSNELSEDTIAYWNKLKQIGGISPKAAPENLVYIAVRDTEDQEDKIMERLSIKNYPVAEVRQMGIANVLHEIENKLADCDMIYVSFDVDSMDPDVTSHGTGTPVKNGLYPNEATEILVNLAQNKKTVCIEFVEVNPCLDEKINTMAEVTLNLVGSVIQALQQ